MLELPPSPPAALLDGAVALALATGSELRCQGPLPVADLSLVLAALKLGGAPGPAVDAARADLTAGRSVLLQFDRPRAGTHLLALDGEGAVARALLALSWPLALQSRPSELRLSGSNHGAKVPSFHELSLGWAPLAARFGLQASIELLVAGFEGERGEVVASLEPAPALSPLQLGTRGLLRVVRLTAATTPGGQGEALRALQEAERRLRAHGVLAESRRVPLTQAAGPSAGHAAAAGAPLAHAGAVPQARWVLTAVAEFENSLFSTSAVGGAAPASLASSETGAWPGGSAEAQAAALSARVGAFLAAGGAVDGAMAEQLLIPALLCAGGVGARAGPPPACFFTTSRATDALFLLASLARQVLPVRAVVDGAVGEASRVVVTPAASTPAASSP